MKGKKPTSLYKSSQVPFEIFGFIFFPLFGVRVYASAGEKRFICTFYSFSFISDLLEFWNSKVSKKKMKTKTKRKKTFSRIRRNLFTFFFNCKSYRQKQDKQ